LLKILHLNNMILRSIKNKIKSHIDKKEFTIITGARQVGKTTLMQEIIANLKAENKPVLFLNLDIDSHARHFVSQDTLLGKIRLEIGDNGFVFIDEIQRLENAGLFLKGIYDRDLNYKFVITGSGSIELKEKIHESLAGRKRLFEMTPVTFIEFVNYKTHYQYTDQLPLFFELEKEQIRNLLLEYLNFGGFPKIVTGNLLEEKIQLMDEIFRSYVEKDLVYLLKIERPEIFVMLIKILAAQTGNIINYSALAKQTNIAVPTLKKYLWYAEKTFCVHYVSPFFTNPLKEITKSPVYYFNDIGLRNYAIGAMGNLSIPGQIGFVFQNFIFNLLRNNLSGQQSNLHFWRSKDKAEVDFILQAASGILPIEVIYSDFKKPELTRSFRSFLEKYNPEEAWIINLFFESEIQLKNTRIKFLPFFKIPGVL